MTVREKVGGGIMSMLERSSSSIEISKEARLSSDCQQRIKRKAQFKLENASSNFAANLESGRG